MQTSSEPGDEITRQVQYNGSYAHMLQSQESHHQQHAYNVASQVPHQAQQQHSSPSLVQITTTKNKQKHYKPIATETPILSLFLLSTFIFIAGIEVILRRGIPITEETTIAPANPEHLLSNPSILNLGISADQLGYEASPYQINIPEVATSCIGIEMIVSMSDFEDCGTVASSKSMLDSYRLINGRRANSL